jgi:biotin carboxyl carrier protein
MRREVRSSFAGSVWSHVATVGQRVGAGAVVVIVECMKTEFPIEAPIGGEVTWLRPSGETIEAEDVVAILDDGA